MSTSNLIVDSNGGNVNVPLTGTAGAPPQMVISPLVNNFGTVASGVTKTMSFTVSNTGGTDLIITKSKPPALGKFVAQTTLAEGSVITAGQKVTETVAFSSSTAGTFSDVWVITGNDTSGVQNVTFSATVASPLSRTGWVASASNTGGTDVPANAIDGNTATRWSTGTPMANGMWFQVDMKSAQTFDQITMDSGGNVNDYARGYQVFVSNDGVNFGTAVATGTGTGALITVSFASQTARYVRVVQTGAATSWWSIVEFNVYGAPTETALSRTGWVASASNTGGADVPANAIDGNTATRWSTGTPMANGMWFQVDMTSAQSFNQITMDSGGNVNDYARGYQVFVSSDGVDFGTAVATGTGAGALITVPFASQTARYVRVVQTGAATSWWSIVEFNVYH
jgi:beta-glucosidase